MSHIFSIYQDSSRVGNCDFLADQPGWFCWTPDLVQDICVERRHMDIIEPFLKPDSPHQGCNHHFLLDIDCIFLCFCRITPPPSRQTAVNHDGFLEQQILY